MATARTTDTEVRLGPGDSLLVLTDGVAEARRGDEFFGDDRVVSVVAGSPASAAATVDELLDQVLAFQAGAPRDDIAIVAVRVPD
jgi:sigma-B regulation protein RsbU (phosphoserine phosphatase)